jgi:phage terminase Nu1 subunit (DNA packaging protein)
MAKVTTKPAQSAGETRNKVGIARMFGVSVKIVETWIAQGMPVVSAPSTRNGEYRISTAAALDWHLDRMAASAGELDLDAERARLAKEQADGQALKNEALRESLIPTAEVTAGWAAAQAVVRKICTEMVIDTVPKLLAAISSAATPEKAERAAREILTKNIDAALNELATTALGDVEAEEDALVDA